jgi:hypothetical protein
VSLFVPPHEFASCVFDHVSSIQIKRQLTNLQKPRAGNVSGRHSPAAFSDSANVYLLVP